MSDKEAKTLGAAIWWYRKRLRISQTELGRRLHWSQQTISGWETGRFPPKEEYLPDIAAALGVMVEALTDKRRGKT